jgi:hypothetical protein
VPPGEVNEIIGQITDATVHLVNVNLDLVQRIAASAANADAEEGAGPAEEAWLTWTESAGDLVQISYLTAQLVDGLWGRRRPPSGPT